MPEPNDGPTTVVYIHGAGPQAGADDLKTAFDDALFGGPARSIVARYAQVFWEQTTLLPTGKDLEPALEAIAVKGQPPDEAAEEVLALIPTPKGFDGPLPDDLRDAHALVAALFARADEVQAQVAAAGPPGLLPEWLFRKLAAKASADVVAYLYDGWRPYMQYPVVEALEAIDDPIIIVAHSLGSILGYEILCSDDFAKRDLRLLVTAGSPLGISNVVHKLNGGVGPLPLPAKLQSWGNFTDRLDLVPLFGQHLRPTYKPQPVSPDDDMVDNPRQNNHDLEGYLGLRPLHDLVQRFR